MRRIFLPYLFSVSLNSCAYKTSLQLSCFSVLLNELVKACEEEFGVSAAAGVVVAAGPAAAQPEEQTEFNVELTEVGAEKVKGCIIKRILLKCNLSANFLKFLLNFLSLFLGNSFGAVFYFIGRTAQK